MCAALKAIGSTLLMTVTLTGCGHESAASDAGAADASGDGFQCLGDDSAAGCETKYDFAACTCVPGASPSQGVCYCASTNTGASFTGCPCCPSLSEAMRICNYPPGAADSD